MPAEFSYDMYLYPMRLVFAGASCGCELGAPSQSRTLQIAD